jgi:hypothetical protein
MGFCVFVSCIFDDRGLPSGPTAWLEALSRDWQVKANHASHQATKAAAEMLCHVHAL